MGPRSNGVTPPPDLLVLCGGRGTRLGGLTEATPKPLLPVAGRPFLLPRLRALRAEGFRRVILAAHYLPEQFRTFMAAYRDLLPETELVVEPTPLGTGGAVRHAVGAVRTETCVILNGDTWLAQPIAPVVAEHAALRRAFTAVVVPADGVAGDARQKGVWALDPQGGVVGMTTPTRAASGWVNAGCYVAARAFLTGWPTGAYSVEAQLPALLGRLRRDEVGVFRVPRPSVGPPQLVDIGTPQVYANAEQLLETMDRATSPGGLTPHGG